MKISTKTIEVFEFSKEGLLSFLKKSYVAGYDQGFRDHKEARSLQTGNYTPSKSCGKIVGELLEEKINNSDNSLEV